MATPSSSATSPSPPMAYLQPMSASQQSLPPNVSDSLERDQRKKAVDKFLARAEIAMITRRLRAQLAYASYKATHNISHASLRDLEAQSQSKTSSFGRTLGTKRRMVGAPNYSNNAATSGPNCAGTGPQRRAGSTSMPPPASVISPRLHTSSIIPPNYNEIASSQRTTGQAPNLFASILATPSTKQVRTVHNPNDPPVPAPERSVRTPKSRASKTSPQNESKTRSSSKGKQLAKNSKDKRRKKLTSVDKGKKKQTSDDMDVDGEMDMKAAATLTSLFLHNRPSINASSPRSSIDGSEAGSSYSHSHFSQSSARTSSQNAPPFSAVAPPSTLATEVIFRSQTPPAVGGHKRQISTPRAAPTDSEAANLMLFLATSPSPARTTTSKDAKDAAAFRTLTGGSGPLRSKGRVLFASSSASDRDPSAHDGVAGSPYGEVSSLSRAGESSFTSSISNIGADMAVSRSDSSGLQSISIAPVSPTPATPSRLLPPAPLPIPSPTEGRNDKLTTLQSDFSGIQSGSLAPVDFFNFHEFINASPSPSRDAGNGHAVPSSTSASGMVLRSNLGLRADVGRKLFDGEQMHVHLGAAAAAATGAASAMMPPPRQEERTLGASIDLVHI